ncbi:protein SRG1 [Tanacetum coccineum]
MADFPVNVGHIPDVQELENGPKAKIPVRFVRDVNEQPLPTIPSHFSSSIPVIDLSKLMKGKNEEFHDEMLKFTASCEEWGFFQVINHGIDLDLLDKMEKLAMEFFMLPIEEKQKYPIAPGTIQGYGQAFVFSTRSKLDSNTLDTYSLELRKLFKELLRFVALSLGLNENIFEEMFGVCEQYVRINYYPPCPRPDLVMGVSPHSDGFENGRYKDVEHRVSDRQENDRSLLLHFFSDNHTEVAPMPEMIGALRSPRRELCNELKYVQSGVKMNEISCLKVRMTNTQTPPPATTVVNTTGAPVTNTVANHAEIPEKFNGQNFKRWQQQMFLYLTTLGLVRFLKETVPQVEPPFEGQSSNAQVVQAVEEWKHSDFLCHNYVLNGLIDPLYNVYCKTTTVKELWESLERKYKLRMLVLIHDIHAEGMTLCETFQAAAIIEKLPPSWGASNASGDVDEEFIPVDVDLNLVKSFRGSFSFQEGLPGPASNLLGLMGLQLPQDNQKDK